MKPRDLERVERAWPGGPLRGTGLGKPSKYLCDDCQHSVAGVYHVKQAYTQAEICFKWLCASCKAKQQPRQEQPEGLSRYKVSAPSPAREETQ